MIEWSYAVVEPEAWNGKHRPDVVYLYGRARGPAGAWHGVVPFRRATLRGDDFAAAIELGQAFLRVMHEQQEAR